MALVVILLSLFISQLLITSPFNYAGGLNLSSSSDDESPTPVKWKAMVKDNIRTISDALNHPEKKKVFSSLPTLTPMLYLRQYHGRYTLPGQTRKRLFYYFFHNPTNPTSVDKPVVLWLGGMSGMSCHAAVFYESGPIRFAEDSNELIWNDHGWNTVSNIIYIDQPIGIGFSYVDSDGDLRSNRVQIITDLYNFLRSFFKHENQLKYAKNDFFIAGHSHAGTYAHGLAYRIHQVNKLLIKNGKAIDINLRGVALGNSLIDMKTQFRTIPFYAMHNNLITEDEKLSLDYVWAKCDQSALECERGYLSMCVTAFVDCNKIFDQTVAKIGDINYFDISKDLGNDGLNYDYKKMVTLLNTQQMKILLKVATNKSFVLSNHKVFEASKGDWAINTQNEISTLLDDGIKVLSYAGEYDLLFNYLGVVSSLKEVKWTGKQRFNDSVVENLSFDGPDNVVGKKRAHGPLTYIMVKGAGNMVARDKPKVALDIIQSWMQGEL